VIRKLFGPRLLAWWARQAAARLRLVKQRKRPATYVEGGRLFHARTFWLFFRSGGLGHDAPHPLRRDTPCLSVQPRRSGRFITVACQCSSQRDFLAVPTLGGTRLRFALRPGVDQSHDHLVGAGDTSRPSTIDTRNAPLPWEHLGKQSPAA
jgi:hypothetical protein